MRMNLLTFGLGLALTGAAVSSGYAAPPAGSKQLPSRVAAIASRLPAKGTLPANETLRLAISLPLRNTNEMAQLLREIYDPASPNYHHYLTPAEFTERFGPSEQDYQKVEDFARASGWTITATHPNHVVLDVSATAADIDKALHVTLRTYRHPTENRDFFAPDTGPIVSASLPILHISGLNNYSLPHSQSIMRPLGPAKQSAGAAPAAGTGPFGSYQGRDFRNAYVPGTTLTGKGQNVGLLQFDGFYSSDITAYENQIGLTTNRPNIVVVPVDGGVPVPDGGNVEVSLDIEMVLSMSPGVSNIYVYEAPLGAPWEDILNRMANDNLARQLSASWAGGAPEPDLAAEQIFQQMALQGQSFFNASGDGDAYNAAAGLPIPFPCDSPHITVVGGTTLTMNGAGTSYASETVWNRGFDSDYIHNPDGYTGSGGGISSVYPIPFWQTNINFVASHGSALHRNLPDVALTADNVYVIYGGGQEGVYGGTSCAAPLWAGFTALINQQAAINGRPPVGFLNPALYAIANSAAYANDFHDTVSGTNTWPGSPDLFYATNNYDLCTGLGTPTVNLINTLTSTTSTFTNPVTHVSAPLPPYGTTLSALIGGNPNGKWQLFFQNVSPVNSGALSNGWILALTTANPVGYTADLGLTMTTPASFVTVGSNFVCTLTLTNYGPSVSSNALVSDTWTPGAALVSVSTTFGSVTHGASTVIWKVGTTNAEGQFMLDTNAGGQMTLTLQANGVGSPYIVNSAIASADTSDFNSADSSASVTVTVSVPSAPQVAGNLVAANGGFQLTVNGSALPTVVQASTNLINWVPVYTNTPPFTFTDLLNAAYPTRFYRASQ